MPNNNPHVKGWLRTVIIFIAYLFIGVIFYPLGLLIAGSDMHTTINDRTELQNIIIIFFDLLATLAVVWIFVKFVDNESFVDIGLKIKNKGKDIFLGILLGLLIMAFALVSLFFYDEIIIKDISFNVEKLIEIILLFILISFKEEILTRGYILRNFMYSFNKYIALILSSFIFSFLHGLNPDFGFISFINIFLAGIMLGLPYIFNKNLWLPIALHFSWNFFQSLLGFNVSGTNSYSLIQLKIPENNLINGGEFGFEGSILSIIVQILLIIILYFWYRKKQNKYKSQPQTDYAHHG